MQIRESACVGFRFFLLFPDIDMLLMPLFDYFHIFLTKKERPHTKLSPMEEALRTDKQIHTLSTGVAPITQVTHVRNKNSNNQGRSSNVVKVISIP